VSRWAVLGRRASRRRALRLAVGALVSIVVTTLVLAVPVMAGTGTDSSVVLGQDRQPVASSAFAGITSAATYSSATGKTSAAPPRTSAPTSARTEAPTASGPSATGPLPEAAPPAPPGGVAAVPPDPAPAPSVAAPEPAAPPVEAAPEIPAPAAPAAPGPAASAASAAPAAAPSGDPEEQVLALVNVERAAAGCGPVSAEDDLTSVARAHSEDMRDRGFFDHENPDGLDPFDRADEADVDARAENIARGEPDAIAVMEFWMNSREHRANILDCGLTELGVGVAEGGGGPWWTQLFA
jgi:uncharacterized protein YkwD